jgi:8-oxo-dGTP pyrophosphatase MutT (NUDIX family)
VSDPPLLGPVVEKVTVFVQRRRADGKRELLLIRHPSAGIQLPAGTVELGETPRAAALREAHEETGLAGLHMVAALGSAGDPLPPDHAVIAAPTQVYARPTTTSFDWAMLPRGIVVQVLRHAPGYVQVSYVEWDRLPDPQYATYTISGWAPATAVATTRHRHFFLLECQDETPPTWTVLDGVHTFTLFWAPLDALPPLSSPQDGWLRWLATES